MTEYEDAYHRYRNSYHEVPKTFNVHLDRIKKRIAKKVVDDQKKGIRHDIDMATDGLSRSHYLPDMSNYGIIARNLKYQRVKLQSTNQHYVNGLARAEAIDTFIVVTVTD